MKDLLFNILIILTIIAIGILVAHAAEACEGNDVDWDNLNRAKPNYCSTPSWMPFRDYYEESNWKVCKIHDNNRGVKGTISKEEADNRFLCDFKKHSMMPVIIRYPAAYISYWWVSWFHK